jgi:putative CocE/NonD family hydrolase
MGPWVHGGWSRGKGDVLGPVRFDAGTSEYYREKIEFPFFSFHLKGKGSADFPEAHVFETGTNQWRKFDAWPPRGTAPRALSFHPNGRLSFDPPSADSANAFDEYVSDPAKPVPFLSTIAGGMAPVYMVDDQRFAGRRPDVLVYQTEVLEADVTLAGPIVASLHVSTTGTDSDWIVKLIDVYPDRFPDEKGDTNNSLGGYQQLVRGDIMRGKFRSSMEKPEPFTPGKPTRIEFALPDSLHTFRRGHRIMVQVQSTWFPLANVNPQKFMNIHDATEADFQKATQRVYRSKSMPSQIRVGVVPQ